MQLVAAVARNSPSQISPVLGDIVPGILKAIQRDDDELMEGGLQVHTRLVYILYRLSYLTLQALEALLLRCPAEIAPFLSSIVQAGTQFIKYDPVRLLVNLCCGATTDHFHKNYAGDDEGED